MQDKFWEKVYYLPVQHNRDDVESISLAEAYKAQAEVINRSGPLYAKLEKIQRALDKALWQEEHLRRKILSVEMVKLKGTQTRTSELVDAFVLHSAQAVEIKGVVQDVRPGLEKLRKRIHTLRSKKEETERRIRALEKYADACDRILNWAKHEHRMELSLRR